MDKKEPYINLTNSEKACVVALGAGGENREGEDLCNIFNNKESLKK